MTFETLIFSNLIFNEEYSRKVLPFLKFEYFQDNNEKIIYNLINDFFQKYNKSPTKEILAIDLSNKNGIGEETFKNCKELISSFENNNDKNLDWLLDKTEKWCQEKAIYNSIMKSIEIIDDKTGKQSKGMIPEILSNALAVSFDSHIGHSYFDDSDFRFEFYHTKEVKIPFDLDFFNKITNGGLPKKTLNIALAGTGVGKSLFMCHCASSNLLQNLNVLYITMEMAEEKIAERIDANVLDIPIDQLKLLPKDIYDKKVQRIHSKTKGKLIIKEYPTASAGSAHFRHLLNELKIKKNFTPDIIYVDYLNICISSRMKYSGNMNSYTYVKAIAEELRGLAVEFNVPIISATQTNRTGFVSSDIGLEDTSESFGLPATADFMFALISTDELEQLNQIMVKQLKNRYNDPGLNKRFVIGIDKSKMKLYDVEQQAQEDLLDGPVFDDSKFGNEDSERSKSKKKFSKKSFAEFK